MTSDKTTRNRKGGVALDGFMNVPEEMDGLANGLEDAAANLDAMEQAPMANAGESIALVAEALGRLTQASVGVSGGLHQGADNIRASRDEYLRTDEEAKQGMPTPPGD